MVCFLVIFEHEPPSVAGKNELGSKHSSAPLAADRLSVQAKMRTLVVCIGVVGAAVMLAAQTAKPVKAEAVDVCSLQNDPAAYNRKLVQVSGLVLYGFENFSLTEPGCVSSTSIWLEYGGKRNSDTTYCCGIIAGSLRSRTLTIDGITLPLVEDALFKRLERRVRQRNAGGSVAVRAKLLGHFFAGEKQQGRDGSTFWGGYGHLGCCSLLVIERVLAVNTD